jgi:hypothetical protein
LPPGPHMYLGGRRQDAVKVEQSGVVLVPIHTEKIRPAAALAMSHLSSAVRLPQNDDRRPACGRNVRSWSALSNPIP